MLSIYYFLVLVADKNMSRKQSLLPKPMSRLSSGNPAVVSESPSRLTGPPTYPIRTHGVIEDPMSSSPPEPDIRYEVRQLAIPSRNYRSGEYKDTAKDLNDIKSTGSPSKIMPRSKKSNAVSVPKVPVIESVFFRQSGHVKLGTRPLGDSAVNLSVNRQWDIQKSTSNLSKPACQDPPPRPLSDANKQPNDIYSRGSTQNGVSYRNNSSVYKQVPSQTDLKKKQVLVVPKQASLDTQKLEIPEEKSQSTLNLDCKVSENCIVANVVISPPVSILLSNSDQTWMQNSGDITDIKDGTVSIDDISDSKPNIPSGMRYSVLGDRRTKPVVARPPRITEKPIETPTVETPAVRTETPAVRTETPAVRNVSRVNDRRKNVGQSIASSSRRTFGSDQTPSSARPVAGPGIVSASGMSVHGGHSSQGSRKSILSASKSNLTSTTEVNSSVTRIVATAGGITQPEASPLVSKTNSALPNKFGKLPTTSKFSATRTSISNFRQKPDDPKLTVLKPARSVSNIAKKDVMSIVSIRKGSSKTNVHDEKNSKSSSRPSSLCLADTNANSNHHRSSLDLNVTYVEHFLSVNAALAVDDSRAVAITSPSELVLKSSDVCNTVGCTAEADSLSTVVMTSKEYTSSGSSLSSKLPLDLKRRQSPRTGVFAVGTAASQSTSRHSDAMTYKNDNFCDLKESPKGDLERSPYIQSSSSMSGLSVMNNATEIPCNSISNCVLVDAFQIVPNASVTDSANAHGVNVQHTRKQSLDCTRIPTFEISSSRPKPSLTKNIFSNIKTVPTISSDNWLVEEHRVIDLSNLPVVSNGYVIRSSGSLRSSRRSSSSSSLSSSSSSTSPASKSTDTIVDSVSSESLYSNPDVIPVHSDLDSKPLIRTSLKSPHSVRPVSLPVPQRPNSITSNSSFEQTATKVHCKTTDASTVGYENRGTRVSTSSLDQIRPIAAMTRTDNLKQIQRIENFGHTPTICEHFQNNSDFAENCPLSTAKRLTPLTYSIPENHPTGLGAQNRRQSQTNSTSQHIIENKHLCNIRRPNSVHNYSSSSTLSASVCDGDKVVQMNSPGQNIIENKHLCNIRRPNSVDNNSSSATLSASHCDGDKAVSEPRRFSPSVNRSIFEMYKLRPAEINAQLSKKDLSEMASNRVSKVKGSSTSSSISSSVSSSVSRHLHGDADPQSVVNKYFSSVQSNFSETSSAAATDDIRTNQHFAKNENQSTIDYVNSSKISRLPMKSKLPSTNVRIRSTASGERAITSQCQPGMSPGIDRDTSLNESSREDLYSNSFKTYSVVETSSKAKLTSKVNSEPTRSIENVTDGYAGKNAVPKLSQSNSMQPDYARNCTPKLVRRSSPESTIVQPKLVKPYSAASAAGRNSAFSLLNAKRNVISSSMYAQVSDFNDGSRVIKQTENVNKMRDHDSAHGPSVTNTVKLEIGGIRGNEIGQWTANDRSEFNQADIQTREKRNSRTEEVLTARDRTPPISSINVNFNCCSPTRDPIPGPSKEVVSLSERTAGFYMDLQNRTSGERDPGCAYGSVSKIDSRDFRFVDCSLKLGDERVASKDSNDAQLYGPASKFDEQPRADVQNLKTVYPSFHANSSYNGRMDNGAQSSRRSENFANNCLNVLKLDAAACSSQTSQNDSGERGQKKLSPNFTDEYSARICDETSNSVDLMISEAEKDSTRNSRNSIYSKLVPNTGKVGKSDGLLLERLDANGSNKGELFVITYESDDIIVLERRAVHSVNVTSSTREDHKFYEPPPTNMASRHSLVLNGKDVVEEVGQSVKDGFTTPLAISPELQQRRMISFVYNLLIMFLLMIQSLM